MAVQDLGGYLHASPATLRDWATSAGLGLIGTTVIALGTSYGLTATAFGTVTVIGVIAVTMLAFWDAYLTASALDAEEKR